MPTKRAIIFDFGGVLMITTDRRYRHQWDDRLGRPHGTVESIVHGSESWRKAQVGAMTPAEYWADVGAQLGLSASEIAQLAADFYAGDTPNGPLLSHIAAWRSAGHPIALLSNFSTELEALLRQHHLDALFDVIAISARIGVMKPAIGAYQYVLDQLGKSPTDCIFVDDMLANVEAATALGLHALHYTYGADVAPTIAALL